MNHEELLDYIKSPDKLCFNSISAIEQLTKKYSYFQTAHLLYVKNLHIENSIRFEKQLKIAAAYVSDRKKIYYLINKPPKKEESSPIEEPITIKPIAKSRPEIKFSQSKQYTSPASIKPFKSKKTAAPRIQKSKISEEYKNQLQDRVNRRLAEIKRENPIANKKKRITVKIKTTPSTQTNPFISSPKPAPKTDKKLKDILKPVQSQKSTNEIIDNFLKKQPSITKPLLNRDFSSSKNQENIEKSENSIIDNSDFVSETLAKIYMNQGNVFKAIKIYEKLILKFPEKKRYFASQIEKLKK